MRSQSHSFFPLRWWSSLRKRSQTRAPQQSRSVRLRLEPLEDRLTPTGPTLTPLALFNGSNGDTPESGVIMDSSGNLYGTTFRGGTSAQGNVFELAKGSSTPTSLANFSNGEFPAAGLIMDSSGNLYGTTTGGGTAPSFAGTVFELVKGNSSVTTLATFNGTNGETPTASLIMDSSGNLYGTTEFGGPGYNGTYNSGLGTIFEVVKGSGAITMLASFGTNGNNGQNPNCSLNDRARISCTALEGMSFE